MKKTIFLILFTLISFTSFSQKLYTPESNKSFKNWISEAKKNGEIDKTKLKRLWEIHNDLEKGSDDANHVYNFGRIIAEVLQPSFSLQNHSYSAGALQLMIQAELAYRYSINHCKCHGRANIMLGMLYNQQKKYTFSEPYLEKGLQLEEGSEDWMVAANQYLLTGAYTEKTKLEKYRKVFILFKKYAPSNSNPYYQKMANMYIPYYE